MLAGGAGIGPLAAIFRRRLEAWARALRGARGPVA